MSLPSPAVPPAAGRAPSPSPGPAATAAAASQPAQATAAAPPDPLVVTPDGEGQSQSPPQATTYRARRRPGLTAPGVAVLTTASSLLFALLSTLVTGGLGWLFGIPFVVANAYCAWEVRTADRRAAVVAAPLTLLLAVVVSTLLADGWGGPAQLVVSVVSALVNAAPMLVVAETAVVAALVARHLRSRRS